jgi:ATP-dependent helicase HepA
MNFQPGQVVCLKSSPETKGVVQSVTTSQAEDIIKVFVNGRTQTYYASQLLIQDDDREENFQRLSCEDFHAYLTALQIRYPGLSTLYSLNAARVNFIPYQFRPVLKFIRSDRPRFLLADGVGVGKTIEAGLILRELQARCQLNSVLIICPRPLVIERKWEIEMRRFDEKFIHVDGPRMKYCINEADRDGRWPEEFSKIIVPFSLFDESLLHGTQNGNRKKKNKGLLALDPPPRFDLIIVDEAHHIRNPETFTHRAVRFFCDHAEAVIFLTATPIQLGNRDMFVLLKTLRPDVIIDEQSFAHMAEPNPFINRAISLARTQTPNWALEATLALDDAAATPWGNSVLKNNPDLKKVRETISQKQISPEERIRLVTDLEGLHTFSNMLSRTRRRDIGEFTIRKPETVIVEFTPAQKDLHDELLRVHAEILSQIHGDKSVKFMMTTLRRQAASCLYGLIPLIEDILNRHVSEIMLDEADDTEEGNPEHDSSLMSRISSVVQKAENLDRNDPKRDALVRIVKEKLNLANNKVMVFSCFRHTLYYLYDHLVAHGIRVGLIHGETPDEERLEMRISFASDRGSSQALDVMLFSEIGCEGLDYQFCDCIINYDLPWNPMRIEQRIGRIDRNGQKSPSVAIINLITPGTVDADIYERCLVRIGVFNNSIGDTEDILGEITQEIRSIAENFSLTDEDRRIQLHQVAENKIRLIQEQEELEQKQLELLGIRLPVDQMTKEVEEASSYWLSPESLQRIIKVYLLKLYGIDQEVLLGEKDLKRLRLSSEARQSVLKDLRKMPRQNSISYREWEKWLQGGNPFLPVTFDPACASSHPEATFINPIHPLVKQASASFDTEKRVSTYLTVKSNDVEAGKHQFVIYMWEYKGIREEVVLQPVASTDALTPILARLLKRAEPLSDLSVSEDLEEWKNLEQRHYNLWLSAREKHRARSDELAQYKVESLTKSHNARMALLNEQLQNSSNEKIRRMRTSQTASAETDYSLRMSGLKSARETADIIAEPVAWGVIEVTPEDSNGE